MYIRSFAAGDAAMQDLSNSVKNGYLRMCDPIQKVKQGAFSSQVSCLCFLQTAPIGYGCVYLCVCVCVCVCVCGWVGVGGCGCVGVHVVRLHLSAP